MTHQNTHIVQHVWSMASNAKHWGWTTTQEELLSQPQSRTKIFLFESRTFWNTIAASVSHCSSDEMKWKENWTSKNEEHKARDRSCVPLPFSSVGTKTHYAQPTSAVNRKPIIVARSVYNNMYTKRSSGHRQWAYEKWRANHDAEHDNTVDSNGKRNRQHWLSNISHTAQYIARRWIPVYTPDELTNLKPNSLVIKCPARAVGVHVHILSHFQYSFDSQH